MSTALTALLICPDRDLMVQFLSAVADARVFQVVAEMRSYPSLQAMDVRLRQLRPDVVLMDVASDLETGAHLIRVGASLPSAPRFAGIHHSNDSEAVLQSLRAGACEFLFLPFSTVMQEAAAVRLRRLCSPDGTTSEASGKVAVFASAKPGSGASTIATQLAFILQRQTGGHVLLIDLDTAGGSIGFYVKLRHDASVLQALENADQLTPALWSEFVCDVGGLEVLGAPEAPHSEPVDAAALHGLLQFARSRYDWILLDVPAVFQRSSLMAMSESDLAFLISTPELPSLHLSRKAVNLLVQLGFPRERYRVVLNRTKRGDRFAPGEMHALLNAPVCACVPNDYFALHRAVTFGQAVDPHSHLSRSLESVARTLTDATAAPVPTALSTTR